MLLQILISGLVIGSIYGLIALGYSLIYKSSGIMSYMQGDIVMLGAFLGYMFVVLLGLPYPVAFVLVMLITLLLGFVIERFIIRRILSLNAGSTYVVFGTLALSVIILNGSGAIWGTETKYFPSIFPESFQIQILGTNIVPEQLLVFLIAVLATVLLNLFLNKSRFGLAMRVATQDRIGAQSLGINVSMTTAVAWAIATMFSGITGILIAPVYGVSMTLGAALMMKAFASAIVGGYGEISGALIGAIIIGGLEVFFSSVFPSEWKNFLVYLLLIIIVQIMPRGIMRGKVYEE